MEFPGMTFTSIQIGSEGEYWTQTSTQPPIYFNEVEQRRL